MATAPVFIATPRIESVSVASANTNRDGTGSIATLIQGAATGTRVLEIVAKAQVATTTACIGIFLSTDSGATWRLFDELTVLTVSTPSASTPSARTTKTYSNLLLKDSTHRIGVTNAVAQSTNIIALGGDL